MSDVKVYQPYDPKVDEPYVYEPYSIDTVIDTNPSEARSVFRFDVEGCHTHKKSPTPLGSP